VHGEYRRLRVISCAVPCVGAACVGSRVCCEWQWPGGHGVCRPGGGAGLMCVCVLWSSGAAEPLSCGAAGLLSCVPRAACEHAAGPIMTVGANRVRVVSGRRAVHERRERCQRHGPRERSGAA